MNTSVSRYWNITCFIVKVTHNGYVFLFPLNFSTYAPQLTYINVYINICINNSCVLLAVAQWVRRGFLGTAHMIPVTVDQPLTSHSPGLHIKADLARDHPDCPETGKQHSLCGHVFQSQGGYRGLWTRSNYDRLVS